MKLGELCEVMNAGMILKFHEKSEEKRIWVDEGTSFQQKMVVFKYFANWDVVGISPYDGANYKFLEVEIVKPEEEE